MLMDDESLIHDNGSRVAAEANSEVDARVDGREQMCYNVLGGCWNAGLELERTAAVVFWKESVARLACEGMPRNRF
ncbi:hypothetical protein NDU88_003983 [Pleurodeles waltl]|uniref:Uncharacterized protein n=1 Tax=Pleurodeles waltl TaxID=8319 RepID=A0AAV7WU16_PLEWA|nr:hypothetical protein NDU88_003983 [Pleurodeles waltl]